MAENITLDPKYADLIIEVNKLKDIVAEKIATRDMLAFHVISDIENEYMRRIGILEIDEFAASMKLLRINRKIELCKERKKFGIEINEVEIENQLNMEFSDIEDEYNEMQEDGIFDMEEDYSEDVTSEFFKLINVLYKSLIKKLSPLINFNNTRLDNQLYELLEKSYRELDLTMMSKLQIICELRNNDSSLTIGDMKTLKKAKKTYESLIDENEEIILNIHNSEAFQKKHILEDEKLVNKARDEIKEEIEKLAQEYEVAQKNLKKILEN